MNDQIPALDGKTLKPYVINYCAYELIERGDENQNAQFFDNRYAHAKSEMAQGDYFPLPEKIFNFEFINKDINHVDCFNEFKAKLLSCDKHFNEIIISYGEDADNINLALNLVSLFKQRGYNDYHVFVRVRTYREEYKAFFDQAKVTFFGYDDFIINHDVLVDESLAIKATAIHDSYENKRSKIAKWMKAPAIKKMSNVYAAMNARLKLNLLGYDADWGVGDLADFIPGEEGFGIIGTGNAAATRGRLGMPRFSTRGLKDVKVAVELWSGANAAPTSILAEAFGSAAPVEVGASEKGEGFRKYTFLLPEEFNNRGWVQLYVDSEFATPDLLAAVSSIFIFGQKSGVEGIASDEAGFRLVAGDGCLCIEGAAGKCVTVCRPDGSIVKVMKSAPDSLMLNLPGGIYMISCGGKTIKAII